MGLSGMAVHTDGCLCLHRERAFGICCHRWGRGPYTLFSLPLPGMKGGSCHRGSASPETGPGRRVCTHQDGMGPHIYAGHNPTICHMVSCRNSRQQDPLMQYLGYTQPLWFLVHSNTLVQSFLDKHCSCPHDISPDRRDAHSSRVSHIPPGNGSHSEIHIGQSAVISHTCNTSGHWKGTVGRGQDDTECCMGGGRRWGASSYTPPHSCGVFPLAPMGALVACHRSRSRHGGSWSQHLCMQGTATRLCLLP